MKKKNLILIILALIIIAAVSGHRETVGNDEIAARVSLFGPISTYSPGDKVLLFPGLFRLLKFKATPITITLSGDQAIVVKAGGIPVAVECQLSYTLVDPVPLIRKFGTEAPGDAIREEISRIVGRELGQAAANDPGFMDSVPARIILNASLLDTITQELGPAGIKPQNLNLRIREKGTKKPA